jgi:hypothetical protein
MKNALIRLTLLGCVVFAMPMAGQQREGVAAPRQESLGDRMHAFLQTIEREPPEALVAFFPRAGDLTWVNTLHKDEGTRVSIWRFPPADIARALKDGPLWASFAMQAESQPIGLFQHQVMMRKAFSRHKGWRLVHGTRFVPAGEPETAGLFVEWRREGNQWVVAAYGDEGFRTAKLPEWCC